MSQINKGTEEQDKNCFPKFESTSFEKFNKQLLKHGNAILSNRVGK